MIFVALDMILVAIKLIILGMLVSPYIYIKHLYKDCNEVNLHYCFFLEINIIITEPINKIHRLQQNKRVLFDYVPTCSVLTFF